MRSFNKREQELIKKLATINLANVNFFSFFLSFNYFTRKSNSAMAVLTVQKSVFLYLKTDIFNDDTKRKEELGKFFELLSLILYLKEERYISIYPLSDVSNSTLYIMSEDLTTEASKKNLNSTKIVLNDNGLYLPLSDEPNIYDSQDNVVYKPIILDKSIYNMVIENLMGLLYVSEELVDLSKRKFRSKEDIKFRKQQFATWVSIILALAIGILGFYLQSKNPHSKNTTHTVIFECCK